MPAKQSKVVNASLRGPNARLRKLNAAVSLLSNLQYAIKIPRKLSVKSKEYRTAVKERAVYAKVVTGLKSIVNEQTTIIKALKANKLAYAPGMEWDGKVDADEDDYESYDD